MLEISQNFEDLIRSVLDGKKGVVEMERIFYYDFIHILKEYGYGYDTWDDIETNEEDVWLLWKIKGKQYCFEKDYMYSSCKFYITGEGHGYY